MKISMSLGRFNFILILQKESSATAVCVCVNYLLYISWVQEVHVLVKFYELLMASSEKIDEI